MADSRKLVLGFIGGDSVKRNNAVELLDDLIGAYHRNNKGAEVMMYLSVEPFTPTMADLADYALTSGFNLGLCGHADELQDAAVKPFLVDAADRVLTVTSEKAGATANKLVSTLGTYGRESRLILIADPDDDDDAYAAVISASGMGVPVRTLLNGLDLVVLESDEDEETPEVPIHDEEDYDEGDEGEDEGEVEGLEEDDGVADLDELDGDEGDIVDADIVGDGGEEVDVDVEGSDQAEAEELPAEENEEERVATVSAVKTKAKPKAKPTKAKTDFTEAGLLKLATDDKQAFYELAAGYGVLSGRGRKLPIMVAEVLAATGGTTNGNGTAPAKKAPAKKAPAAKKTAPPKATATTGKRQSPRAKPAAPTAETAGVSKATHNAAMKLIAVAEDALALAKTLL